MFKAAIDNRNFITVPGYAVHLAQTRNITLNVTQAI